MQAMTGKLFVIVILAVLGGVGGYAFLELAIPAEESRAVPSRSQVKRAVWELLQDELGRRGYKLHMGKKTFVARGNLRCQQSFC